MGSVTQSGTGVGTYGYDAFDQRVSRQNTGTGAIDHDYIYDAEGRLLAEHDATTGDVVREYIWVGDMPVAMVDQSSGTEHIYFIHTSQTGEPLMMTDSSKAAVWDDYLDPYGVATPLGTDTVSLDLRYPGQWLQPETGNLAQNWFRDYDPSLGRYAETDPLGIEAGQNPYFYVENNPMNTVDYDGREPCTKGEDLTSCTLHCIAKHYLGEPGATLFLGSGARILPYPRSGISGGTGGTSIASRLLRKAFPQVLENGALRSRTLGAILGRAVPYVGWGLTAYDAVAIGICTYKCVEGKQ